MPLGRHDLQIVAVFAPEDLAVAHERAALDFLLAAEPVHLRAGLAGQTGASGIVSVQDRVILRRLVLEDPRLGQHVGVEAVVAVEMVGRDVEDDGDFGMEALDALELEAGDLQHVVGVRGRIRNQRDGGRADVAAHQHLVSAHADDFAGQRRGGGLAVGAGDGEDVSLEKPRRQLDFADDGNALRARLLQLRHVAGHARADHDQVLVAEGALAVPAGLDRNAFVEERGDRRAKLVFGLGVGHADARARDPSKRSPRPRPTCPGRRPERVCL